MVQYLLKNNIHRGLKPQNILLTDDSQYKKADLVLQEK